MARVTKVIQFRCPYGQVHRSIWKLTGRKAPRYCVYTDEKRGGRSISYVRPLWAGSRATFFFPFFFYSASLLSAPSFLIGCVGRDDINTPTQPPLWPHPLRRPPSLFNSIFIFPKTNSKFKGKNVGGKNSGIISDLVYFWHLLTDSEKPPTSLLSRRGTTESIK